MKGILSLVLAGFFLGTVGIWTKLIGSSVSPFALSMLRVLISSAFIALFAVAIRKAHTLKIDRKSMIFFLLAGFFGVVIGCGFFMWSFYYVPVANAVILVHVYPVATAILAWAFLGEKITKREVLAIILVLAGVWSIFIHEINLSSNMFGNFLAISAGLGYSVFIITMRYFQTRKNTLLFFSREGLPYWTTSFWPLFLGGVMLFMLLPFQELSFNPQGNVLLLSFYLAAFGFFTFLAYIFYSNGLSTTKASDAAIATSLTEPLTGIILAFLILGEPITDHIFIGGSLIIIANLILGYKRKKHAHHHSRL